MINNDIYRQMAERTQGNVYIGVVGPVRTGKSTFINKFMQLMVLPSMKEGWIRERYSDEMPQGGNGRSIMTTQVQFIPEEAVEVNLDENTSCSMRLIDSVGYMVEGAIGHMEDGKPRMVTTPWFDEPVEFEKAAVTGTKKVITDYSTIGIVVTTDGSICGLDRNAYLDAEQKAINELKALGKPFVVIVNSISPFSPLCTKTVKNIKDEYDVKVRAVNVMEMNENDIIQILGDVLYEFPAKLMSFAIPDWLMALPQDNWVWEMVLSSMHNAAKQFSKISDYEKVIESIEQNDNFEFAKAYSVYPGSGEIEAGFTLPRRLFYNAVSDRSGIQINDDGELLSIINEMASAKHEYDYFKSAIEQAKATGYGVAQPRVEELELEEPEIVKHGNGYGVSLKATAPSWHIMKADVSAQIEPMVGTQMQGENLVKYLLDGFEDDPAGIWETKIFGKSLDDLMREGLNQKLSNMPSDARIKMRDTIERVINDSGGGLICILF
jgi:stage IV sporulation protein A